MIKRVAILSVLMGLTLTCAISAEDQPTPDPVKKTIGDKIEGMARYAWKQVHDHPYLAALGLWCGVYHKIAYEKLSTYGSSPWLFIPVVGTMLFYVLHDQHDFIAGKIGENDHLEFNINLSNAKKENK